MLQPRINAPELFTPHGWLNTNKALQIESFKGKVLLVYFFSYGHAGCIQTVDYLHKYAKIYANELAIVCVHSAKFTAEKEKITLPIALERLGIYFPVIADPDYSLWKQFAINTWPTFVLIDPEGRIVGQKSGADSYEIVKANIKVLIDKYAPLIDQTPWQYRQEPVRKQRFHFPEKLSLNALGYLFLSDTGNHRIVALTQQGKTLYIIGSGQEGLKDGSFSQAQLHAPRGSTFLNEKLYFIDSINHAIRVADLENQVVTTLYTPQHPGYITEDNFDQEELGLCMPWDLAVLDEKTLLVASAGNDLIFSFDIQTNKVKRFIGSGRQRMMDGHLKGASFGQPSGISVLGQMVYVADTTASAIREINLTQKTVKTVVGRGLFDFGDVDGYGENARLQHPEGVFALKDIVYVADTFNGKIKFFRHDTGAVRTLLTDLKEPRCILYCPHQELLFFVETNAHAIGIYDLNTKQITRIC